MGSFVLCQFNQAEAGLFKSPFVYGSGLVLAMRNIVILGRDKEREAASLKPSVRH